MTQTYEVLALRYATRGAKRQYHFISEVPDPQAPMPMDYFVWVLRSPERIVMLDTGFKPDVSARRGRTYVRSPMEALGLAGIAPGDVGDIVLSHMHYDHAGTVDAFPNARLHIQEQEIDFVTSRKNEPTRRAFEVDDVNEVLRGLYGGRVKLYNGSAQPWPGVSIHLVGGHTAGSQIVRVHTKRGWVVLAADASHFYENMERGIPFHGTYNVEQGVASFDLMRALADSHQHVVPGHDPEVVKRYPSPSPALEGIAMRLDEPPREA
jgi:glyoxylase-like metal-dependent hydrolase (beta-lactamase superfamily II)